MSSAETAKDEIPRPTLETMFEQLRARIEEMGPAREVSVALTNLDSAKLWALDFAARPAKDQGDVRLQPQTQAKR